MEVTRENAWALLTEFVTSPTLLRHCLSVEAAMRAYARRFGEDEEAWGFVGLLHDYDYEIHPTLDEHPQAGFPLLRERGVPEWVITAIASHADHLEITRTTRLEKTLYAVDELTGFIAAVAFVRPSKAVADVTPEAVRKKMKDRAFARAVDREALVRGADELGFSFEEHVQNVINAMTEKAEELGLAGVNA